MLPLFMKSLCRGPDLPSVDHVRIDKTVLMKGLGNCAIVAFRLVPSTRTATETKVTNDLNTGVFVRHRKTWQVFAWKSTEVPQPKQSYGPTEC